MSDEAKAPDDAGADFCPAGQRTIQWAEIEALFVALGAEASRREGPSVGVFLFGEVRVFHRPLAEHGQGRGRQHPQKAGEPRSDALKNVIELDGHRATVTYDPEVGMLRGEFLGLNGGADFHARSVDDLAEEGLASLRVFLAIRAEKGIAPERAFSGRSNVRLDPAMHEAAVLAAAASDKSLNEWVAEAIEAAAQAA